MPSVIGRSNEAASFRCSRFAAKILAEADQIADALNLDNELLDTLLVKLRVA